MHDHRQGRVPDPILAQGGLLTEEAFDIMKTRAAIGFQIPAPPAGVSAFPRLFDGTLELRERLRDQPAG